jgi:hypothetical protein
LMQICRELMQICRGPAQICGELKLWF